MILTKYQKFIAGGLFAFVMLGLVLGLVVFSAFILAPLAYKYLKGHSIALKAYFVANRVLIGHRSAVIGLMLLMPFIALIHAGRGMVRGVPGELAELRDIWRGLYA